MEAKNEGISPKDNLLNLYSRFDNSYAETKHKLREITDKADDFAEEPENVQAMFQALTGKVMGELPDMMVFKLKSSFSVPTLINNRPANPYEGDYSRHYYSPKLNIIYSIEDNEKVTLEEMQKRGTPFEGQNANLDSIESIMEAMSTFIKSEEGKTLLNENKRKINELKQKVLDDFENEKKIGVESIKIHVSKYLEAIKNYMGKGKIPSYIPLWMDLMVLVGKKTPIDQGRLDPYLSTRDSKIIMAPTLVKEKLFKTEYSPDIGKSKAAGDDKWLNSLLPVSLAGLLPKQIRNELRKHK